MKRGTLLAATATMAALALPPAANAATSVAFDGEAIVVTGDAFRNDIEVRRVADGYRISDSAAALKNVPGSPCVFTDPDEIKCSTRDEVDVTVEGRAAADDLTAIGTTRRVVLDGGDGTDRLVGGAGPDRLIGGPNGDTLLGSAGNDLLIGEAGPDSLQGGDGTDTVSYAERTAGVTLTLPVDSFDERGDDGNATDGAVPGLRDAINDDVENAIGGDGDDSVLGNNDRNGLQGRRGSDVLSGRGGNDVLEGGREPDILNGNDGVDLAVYDDHTQAVSLSLDDVANDGNIVEDGILNSPANAGKVDNIRADVEGVIGGQGPDTITGNSGANRLEGAGGDDLIDGGPGPDDIKGGFGEDTLTYATRISPVRVTLDGVADDGSVAVDGADNAGADLENVIGTIGDDLLRGNNRANTLEGRSGNDVLEGLESDDTLDGAQGSDVLDGGTGADTATFADGPPVNVTLDGVANDTPIGAAFGPNDDNVLTENVIGSASADTIVGNDGVNVLSGNGGNDTIRGAGGADRITGDAGLDVLSGDAGNDVLNANDGARDEVTCGADLDSANLDLQDIDAVRGGGLTLAVASGCESQSIAPAGRLPNVAVAKVVRIGGGAARVKLRCPTASHVLCAGTLRLQRLDGTELARGRFALRKSKRTTLALRLRRPAGRGAAQVLASERDSDRRAKVTLARVKLKRR